MNEEKKINSVFDVFLGKKTITKFFFKKKGLSNWLMEDIYAPAHYWHKWWFKNRNIFFCDDGGGGGGGNIPKK